MGLCPRPHQGNGSPPFPGPNRVECALWRCTISLPRSSAGARVVRLRLLLPIVLANVYAGLYRHAARALARRLPRLILDKMDCAALGRADSAFEAVFAHYESLILDVKKDRGLSQDQRGAALLALKQRQKIEAEGARKRIIDEERQRIAALRKRAMEFQAGDSMHHEATAEKTTSAAADALGRVFHSRIAASFVIVGSIIGATGHISGFAAPPDTHRTVQPSRSYGCRPTFAGPPQNGQGFNLDMAYPTLGESPRPPDRRRGGRSTSRVAMGSISLSHPATVCAIG